jgi:hypothetical protein
LCAQLLPSHADALTPSSPCSPEFSDVAGDSVEVHPVVLASLAKTGIHKECLAKDGEQRSTDPPQQPRAGTLNTGGEAVP